MNDCQVVKLLTKAARKAIKRTKREVRRVWGRSKTVYAYETLIAFNIIRALAKKRGSGSQRYSIDHEVQYAGAWKAGKADIALSPLAPDDPTACSIDDRQRVLIEVKWMPGPAGKLAPLVSDLRKLCWASAASRFLLAIESDGRRPDDLQAWCQTLHAQAADPEDLAGWRSTDQIEAAATVLRTSRLEAHPVGKQSILIHLDLCGNDPLTK